MNTTHTQAVNRQIRRWTKEEEVLVVNNIKSFPDNIQEAFRKSERELTDRNLKAIEQKYYNNLKKDYLNIISVGTSKGFSKHNTKNRANLSEGQGTPLVPALKPFQRIAMEMMQLSREDLNKLLDFFK